MEQKSEILLRGKSHTGVTPGKSPAYLLTEACELGLLSNNKSCSRYYTVSATKVAIFSPMQMYTKNVQRIFNNVGLIFQIQSDFRQLPQLLIICKKNYLYEQS